MNKSMTTLMVLLGGLGVSLVPCHGQALPAAPAAPLPFPKAPSRTFPVTKYGAVGDGKTKNTEAFQKAFDACGAAGGGEVIVPAGTFLIGSVTMKAHTTLRLAAGATVLGSDDIADYPMTTGRWEGLEHPVHRGLISADGADAIAIVGEATSTLQSGPTVGAHRNPRGPVLFEPVNCHGVQLSGLTLKHASVWTVHPTFCTDITVSHVNFDTHGGNADGFDPDSCSRIRVADCTFSTGDDCISLKSGKGSEGAKVGKPTEDVLVTGCTFVQGHGGVAMGSEVSGGVRRVRVEHCVFKGGNNALLVKTTVGRGGFVEDITGEDLTVSNTNVFVVNTLYHSNPDSQPVTGPAGITPIRNIRIHGVKADAKTLIDVVGFPQLPVDNLVLSDITGTCQKPITISNAKGVALSGISVTGYKAKVPLMTLDNVQGTGLTPAGH